MKKRLWKIVRRFDRVDSKKIKQKNNIYIKHSIDTQSYLEANTDVKIAIERGDFKSADEHLQKFGLKELQEGKRKFHKDFEPYNEELYKTTVKDLENEMQENGYSTPFEHFINIGCRKIIEEEIEWDKITNDNEIKKVVPNYINALWSQLDVNSFLEANSDIKEFDYDSFVSLYVQEIQDGKRKFHRDFEPYNEEIYLNSFEDIKRAVELKEIESVFEHFCRFGYKEIIDTNRSWNSSNKLIIKEKEIIDVNNTDTDSIEIKYNIDRFDSKILEGWIYIDEIYYKEATIELYIDNRFVSKQKISIYREDLRCAGIGNGFCGFRFDLNLNENYIKKIFDLIVITKERKMRIKLYGTEMMNIIENNSAAFMVALNKLHSEISTYLDKNINIIPYLQSKETHNKVSDIRDKIFEIDDELGITKYQKYIYYRHKTDKVIKFAQNKSFKNDFLFWYTESFVIHRKPLRIPMNNSQNKLINFTLAEYPISEYHLNQLFKNNNTENLKDKLTNDAVYSNMIFDFIYDSIENKNNPILIPETYKKYLKKISAKWINDLYPLNNFIEILFNRNTAYHLFNLASEAERFAFYIYFIIYAIKDNPWYLEFVPSNILKLVLKNKSNEINILQTILKKINYSNSNLEEIEYEDNLNVLSYENIKNYLLLRGFNIEKQSITFINKNKQLESFRYTIPDSYDTYDIQVIGPFEKASGLGQATRLSADILEKAGYNIHRVDFDIDNPAPEGFNGNISIDNTLPKKAKINLIHLNAESLPMVIAYMPDVFSDAYNIGYFYWELDTPAKCHELALEIVDEIWVSTEYGVGIYEPFVEQNTPVSNVRMAYEEIDIEIPKDEAREFLIDEYGFDKDDFIFLATFDSFSFIQRKNPVAVVKSFLQAFPTEDNVKLLIKTHNRYRILDPVQLGIWDEIDELIGADDRIVLVNETFTYENLLKFKKGTDCYISLHRSEGWGFGMIEAMNLGIPIIATAYSGNMEFCNSDNSWLVDYDEVYLNENDYIFVKPGQKWAEPKIDSAVKAMQEAYKNPELREQKAQNALKFIKENFSIDAISQRYKSRIDDIMKEI